MPGNFVGRYELGPETLRLDPGATTMNACLDLLMRQERAILDAPRATTDPRIAGTELELRGDGKLLARLEARHLR